MNIPTPRDIRAHRRDLVVYVDGFNLYHGLHDAAGRRRLWLDLVALAHSLRPRSNLVQVKYFTAPVLNEPAAASRQDTYIKALVAQNPGMITVVNGRYQSRDVRCRGCGRVRPVYEEKETDVNIAIHLVADALSHTCQDAILISADSDLAPAVEMVHRTSPGTFVAAAFPPRRYSSHLKSLMPHSMSIAMSKINKAQLPEVVADAATGMRHRRPEKWGPGR